MINAEVTYQDLAAGFQTLGIDRSAPIIAHASLSSFGWVRGGAETVAGALLAAFDGVMMPVFTYSTMVIPETGPPGNGLEYGRSNDRNRMAVPFSPAMPADRLMGAVPETFRNHRLAHRSNHPILSFTGVGVSDLLDRQRFDDPFAPIRALVERDGWILLLGVDQSVNTTLHEAERRAGRKTFTRWALNGDGVRVCAGFPGCSNGFVDLDPVLDGFGREVRIGEARVQAFPAPLVVEAARAAFADRPGGYLCKRIDCGRCAVLRVSSLTSARGS
ncbi:MAG TPA: AAC(3) family N-acetyltransferase [Anaerolineales bacterium]|nr:AAC(3) family N-acetyltransferase [Anaerolineales bacterium]